MQGRCLVPLAGTEVLVSGGYWARRQLVNRLVSEPSGFESLRRSGTLANFELAAGPGGRHRGEYFTDSDAYKWLEAVGWELGRAPGDEHAQALRSLADQVIDVVRAAQEGDGYLGTWVQLEAPEARFADLAAGHELYCAGHLFEAAAAWARGPGDERLLDVAERFADYIGTVFGPGRRKGVCGHPEVELGLVQLYRVTGRDRYLDLARFFIDERGYRLLGDVHYGARYRQDDVPFRRSREARGHAVRAAYLAAGALDVFLEDGDDELLDAAIAQWEDMVSHRMYITGGIGSRHKDESFGDPFELPPDRAYAETCAAIGVIFWSWRLLLATGEVRYADLIERVLFNGFAAGVSLDGGSYFYVNPLQVRSEHADPEDGRGSAARSGWYQIACCPPNVMRLLSSLDQYLATGDGDGVQVWQYAPSRLTTAGGSRELTVETAYPERGHVRVRVERAGPERFEIALRIPRWAAGARARTVTVDGDTGWGPVPPGAMWRTARSWRPGDELVLDLPMPARMMVADPRIDAVRGCAAVARGPLVYCLEEADAGPDLESIRLPADPRPRSTMVTMNGEQVPALDCEAVIRRPAGMAPGTLPYHDAVPWDGDPVPASIRLVPYYSWGNRLPGNIMRTWIPRT